MANVYSVFLFCLFFGKNEQPTPLRYLAHYVAAHTGPVTVQSASVTAQTGPVTAHTELVTADTEDVTSHTDPVTGHIAPITHAPFREKPQAHFSSPGRTSDD